MSDGPVTCEELLEKDLVITKRALGVVKNLAPERSYLYKVAEDFLQMANSYYQDALHFRDGGDPVRALACVNYAHAWLDAGARLGFFHVGMDDQLFTLAY